MQWDDVPKIPEDADGIDVQVRAPACPVDNAANWRQILIAIVLFFFMSWLAFEALTKDPISWIPGILALIGVAAGIFMVAAAVKSRLRRVT